MVTYRATIEFETNEEGLIFCNSDDLMSYFAENPTIYIRLKDAYLCGSDECDECDGSGIYYINGEPQKCICSEPQE